MYYAEIKELTILLRTTLVHFDRWGLVFSIQNYWGVQQYWYPK